MVNTLKSTGFFDSHHIRRLLHDTKLRPVAGRVLADMAKRVIAPGMTARTGPGAALNFDNALSQLFRIASWHLQDVQGQSLSRFLPDAG
jgi:hypothetical protein